MRNVMKQQRNKALEKVYSKMIDDLTDKHMIQAYRGSIRVFGRDLSINA